MTEQSTVLSLEDSTEPLAEDTILSRADLQCTIEAAEWKERVEGECDEHCKLLTEEIIAILDTIWTLNDNAFETYKK